MNSDEVTRRLADKGVKATANRILVYRALHDAHRPMSMADVEAKLLSLDRSSIFRVLTLFLQHDVLHAFEDGRGVLHYEMCDSTGACNHTDSHLHFYCETCHQTFCLDQTLLPDIELPAGFSPHSVSFVIKGTCPDCMNTGAHHHH
ncbi:MAG: transcriptional repressor [Prevotella sp.]|nr:transcriptional repressor [Prevotella sp.]